MPSRLALQRVFAAVSVAALAGCGVQADTAYRGEPLLSLDGTLTSGVADPPMTLQAVLGWNTTANPGGDTFVNEQAAVMVEFPSRFQLEVYEPPVEQALNDYTRGGQRPDEVRIGVAHFVAWPSDYDPAVDGDDGPAVFGVAVHQLLVYVERDVEPGTFSAGFLGGELEAGFHVMDVTDRDDPSCQGDFDCMQLAPDDLDSEIRIHIDEAELLDVPDWS